MNRRLLSVCFIGFLANATLAFAGAAGPVADAFPSPPPVPVDGLTAIRDQLSCPILGDYDIRRRHAGETPWLSNRISRCFFGPIKRPPFFRDELADDVDYYPEPYLDRLAREGVNGLWLTIEFADFSKEPTGDWPEGAQRRLAKLRRTVEKCARHGIRIWLFCIEPIEQDFRRSPLALKHPDWIGCTYDNLMGTMCASHPGVQKYIENTVRDIFTAVPGLGGIINISNGEKVTSCLSIVETTKHPCRTVCARCGDVPLAELLHRVNRAFVRGIRAAGSDAEFISWVYKSAPVASLPDWVIAAAGTSPDGVIQQVNFETGIVVEQEGRRHIGGDYWLSQPGPSSAFVEAAKAAKDGGRRISAKIQVSCSHEIATIPVLPVPGLLYRKFKGMREQGVTDAMYCWYFGSAPGLMNKAAGELAYVDFGKEDEQTFLLRLAADDWGEDAAVMAEIWKACSDGFVHYPVSNHVQYYGPYHQGVVWPLRADIEMRPLGDSWMPNQPAAGDMIGECLADFELQEALSLAQKMCAETEKVVPGLESLERKYAEDAERSLDLGLVRAFLCHLEAARNVFEFYSLRRDAVTSARRGETEPALRSLARMREIVLREKVISETMKRLCERDARLGFHSEAESYLYTPAHFDWHVSTLAVTAVRLDEIRSEILAGHGYPLSEFEKKAPVFPARTDEHGNLVLQGEAKGTGDVTVWVWDACGTRYQKDYVVTPRDGRFSLTVSACAWRDDARLRPAWIQVHQGCSHLGDSWRWPECQDVPWRWHHRDLLGFHSARIVVEEKCAAAEFSEGALKIAKAKIAEADRFRKENVARKDLKSRIATGGSFGGYFLWDTAFAAIWAARLPKGTLPAVESLDNFYTLADENGFINREYTANGVRVWEPSHPNAFAPPLLSWAEMELFGHGHTDVARLEIVFPKLRRHHDFCKAHYRRPDGLYFGDQLGCGMDDMRRYPRGMTTNELMNSGGIPFTVDSIGPESKHFIRAAFLRDVIPDHYWNRQMGWIDMSAQMALDARMLAEMAERIGRANDALNLRAEHAELAAAINRYCWSDELGFYGDYYDGKVIPRKSAAAFWVLLAKVATPDRAAIVRDTFMDERFFLRPNPFPALSADDPDYQPEKGYWNG